MFEVKDVTETDVQNIVPYVMKALGVPYKVVSEFTYPGIVICEKDYLRDLPDLMIGCVYLVVDDLTLQECRFMNKLHNIMAQHINGYPNSEVFKVFSKLIKDAEESLDELVATRFMNEYESIRNIKSPNIEVLRAYENLTRMGSSFEKANRFLRYANSQLVTGYLESSAFANHKIPNDFSLIRHGQELRKYIVIFDILVEESSDS